MQANFLLKREMNKNLVCDIVRSPNVIHHFHSHIELYLIKSGKIEIMINDNKKVLGPGEISVALSYIFKVCFKLICNAFICNNKF